MAELKVQVKGDAKELKTTANEVVKIMGDASKAMIAEAKAADAAILASRKDEAKKEADLAKEKLKAATDAAKSVTDAERAAAKERVSIAKAEANAKASALKSVSAEYKKAFDASRAASRDMARDARNAGDARRDRAFGGGQQAGDVGDISTMIKGAAIIRAMTALDQFAKAMEAATQSLVESSLTAEQRSKGIIDSLAMAGFKGGERVELGAIAFGGVKDKRFTQKDVSSALTSLRGGRVKPKFQDLADTLLSADQANIGGSVSLLGEGFGSAESLDIASRFASASGGAPLTRELAKLAQRMRGGASTKTPAQLAAFLAASNAVGAPSLPNRDELVAQAQAAAQDASMAATERGGDVASAQARLDSLVEEAKVPMGGRELKANTDAQGAARSSLQQAITAKREAERIMGERIAAVKNARASRPEDTPFSFAPPALLSEFRSRMDRAGGVSETPGRLEAAKEAAQQLFDANSIYSRDAATKGISAKFNKDEMVNSVIGQGNVGNIFNAAVDIVPGGDLFKTFLASYVLPKTY